MKNLLLVFAAFVVMGQGCLLLGVSGDPELENCKKNSTVEAEEACYVAVAAASHDPEACERINTAETQDSCWLEIAVGTNDVSACNGSSHADAVEDCIVFFANQGLQQGINDCQQHEDVDTCLAHRATVKQNPIVCEATSDYDACLEEVLEDSPAGRLPCENVEGQNAYECYVSIARTLDDIQICEQMTDVADQDRCKLDASGGLENAAEYWGTTICILADPTFWEGFFDDETADEAAKSAQAEQNLLTSFGYGSFDEAEADIVNYANEDRFQRLTTDHIENNCLDRFNDAGLNFEDIFNVAL